MAKTVTAEKTSKNEGTNKKSMFIVKIKLNNDNTATIFYRTTCDSNAQEVYYTGKEPVTEEFQEIFQKTSKSFVAVIPSLEKELNKIQMNAIKLDYDKSEFLKSALFSVKYAFNEQNNAVINISTPPLPIYKEGMENTFCISGKDEELLHEVIAKAKAYINGETRVNQQKLNLVIDNTEK